MNRGRINEFRSNVLAELKRILPNLKSCEPQFGRFDLNELEREMIKAPGVRLAILRGGMEPQPDGHQEARLSCVAFIITEGKDRDESGWAIAEAIATLLHSSQLWGMLQLSAPSAVVVQPIISAAIKSRGVGVMSVEWSQTLRKLGDGLFGPDNIVLPDAYINNDPFDLTEASDG
jgi:hypothetical protein